MFWLLVGLMLLYTAFLEAAVEADVRHFDSTRVQIQLRLLRWHRTWRLQLASTPQGHRLILDDERQVRPLDGAQLRQSRGLAVAGTLRRADKARGFLLKHLHLDRLDALVLLRTEDAARSALLSGTVQSILRCIPALHRHHVRLCVLPEFFRAHSTVNVRCIIRFRLGTIILTAGMLLLAWFREQHLTESEETAYGTSHR